MYLLLVARKMYFGFFCLHNLTWLLWSREKKGKLREQNSYFFQLPGSVVSVLSGVSNWDEAVNCIYRHRGSGIYSEHLSEKEDQIRIAA